MIALKNTFRPFSGLALLGALLALPAKAVNEGKDYLPGKYTVDPDHTRVSFVVGHFAVSEVEGRFNQVKGEFTLGEKFEESSATVTVPVASIDTGVKKRDDDLRSPNFFDAKKFPTMKFVTKKFSGSPDKFTVTADLTIKDVTKEVKLDGKYTGNVKDPWGNQRVALHFGGVINRKDFHINYDNKVAVGPAVGEEVQIRIWTEGLVAKDASSLKNPPQKEAEGARPK